MSVHYFEMLDPTQLSPATSIKTVDVREVNPPDGSVNQCFYLKVGRDWAWRERADWTLEKWQKTVSDLNIVTLALYHGGDEIGYSEIRTRDGDVEILNFGLLPDFIGQDLGGVALFVVVDYAWKQLSAHRVWLHTCDRDHPNAINNYKRRGFVWYKTEED